MTPTAYRGLRAIAILGIGLLLPAVSDAQIFDDANLVKKETIERANQRIQKLFDNTDIRLVFDIVPRLPEELAKDFDKKTESQRRELVDRWAAKRMTEVKAETGLYVLLCSDPKRIEIRVWPKNNTELFNDWYQRELRRRIIANVQPDFPDQKVIEKLHNSLRNNNRDRGLLDVVNYTCGKLAYNRPVDQTVWYWSLSVIGFVLCGCAILGFVRTKLRRVTPPEAGVFGEEVSDRSVAVLGGGIGAVASQWLLAVVFGREREPEPPQSAVGTGMEPVIPPLPPRIAEHELHAADEPKNEEEPAAPGAA